MTNGTGKLLAGFGVVGMFGTVVLAVTETPKAMRLIEEKKAETKLDKVKAGWTAYIPAVITGAATIACIVGSVSVSTTNQAAISSAFALATDTMNKYQGKVKEIFGEEGHQRVVEAIVKEDCVDTPIVACGGFYNTSTRWDVEEPDKKRTFYDLYSQRYFESTIPRVLEAEYHFNRNYALGGSNVLNEFYEFLGLEKIEGGDDIGWSVYRDEIYWVDFDHTMATINNDMEVCVISFVFNPVELTEEY